MESLGESGFDEMRFGAVNAANVPIVPNSRNLKGALPVLMNIVGKQQVLLRELTARRVQELVDICAGEHIEITMTAARPETLHADLLQHELQISEDGACGLCDLLLMATLFRVVDEGGFSATDEPDALLEEAMLTLLDELPQSETYSKRAYHLASTTPGVFSLFGRACVLKAYQHEPDDHAAATLEHHAA